MPKNEARCPNCNAVISHEDDLTNCGTCTVEVCDNCVTPNGNCRECGDDED